MGEFLGKRVIPRHEGDWDKARSYEPLMIVLDPETGDGYISRYDVPAGTLLTNEHYWAKCSHFNAQMHRLETDVAEDVEEMHSDLASTKAAMSNELKQTHEKMAEELSDKENQLNTSVKNAVASMQNTESKMDDSVDMLTKRLDANVAARTNENADYAAELVDSRVDYMGQTHENAGTAVRKQIQGVYRAFGFGDNKLMLFELDEPEMIKIEEIVLPPKEEEAEGKTVKQTIYIFPPEWAGTFGQPITSIAQVGILQQEHYAGNWDVLRPAAEIKEMNTFTADGLNALLHEAEEIMEGWTDTNE